MYSPLHKLLASCLLQETDAVQKVATTTEPKSLLQATIDAGRQIIEDIPATRTSIEGAPEAFGESKETPKELKQGWFCAITQVLQEAGLVDGLSITSMSSMSIPSMLERLKALTELRYSADCRLCFRCTYRSAVSNGFLYGDAAFVPVFMGHA